MEITPVGAVTLPAAPMEAQPVQPIVERQLFDYLAEVERSGAGQLNDPAALAKAAMESVDSTMRKVQEALGKAHAPVASETVQAGQANTPGGEAGRPSFEDSASQLLERSMSVMWAAANLEVVVSSVTAVTSSTSTLIKQQ